MNSGKDTGDALTVLSDEWKSHPSQHPKPKKTGLLL